MREAEIVEAAIVEFSARGYAGTRLEDVAKRAGIAKGLPLFYFGRKEELFKAVVRRLILPDWEVMRQDYAQPAASSADQLRALMRTIYERLVRNERARALVRLLVAESAAFPELAEFYRAEIILRAASLVQGVVARGIETGEFRPVGSPALPQILIGPALLAVLWQLLFADRHTLDLDLYFEAHLDMVLNGLAMR